MQHQETDVLETIENEHHHQDVEDGHDIHLDRGGGESRFSDITPSSSHRQELQHQESNILENMENEQHHWDVDACNVEHEHQQHRCHDGGVADSRFSNITKSSSHHLLKSNISGSNRGRTMDHQNGRLGTHIRSTSANSRTHPPVPASPGMDSDFAMPSHASTEKDVDFLNEGVDAFYEEQTVGDAHRELNTSDDGNDNGGDPGPPSIREERGPGRKLSARILQKYSKVGHAQNRAVAAQQGRNDRRGSTAHYQRIAEQMRSDSQGRRQSYQPHTLQQKSSSHSKINEEEGEQPAQHPMEQDASAYSPLQTPRDHSNSRWKARSHHAGEPSDHPSHSHLPLSKPYDMTKTKSTGTSFTQKTQKMSNMSPFKSEPPTSRLRSEMAWKYKMQKGSGPTPKQAAAASRIYGASDGSSPGQQQQRQGHPPSTQRAAYGRSLPERPRSSPSPMYSNAIQNARERRERNNHRLS